MQGDKIKDAQHLVKKEYIILASILLGALIIRLMALKAPMRYDESFTFLYYVSRGYTFIISDYFRPNNHILHSLLVWWSTFLLGIQPWAIRLPALIAGILTVMATYWAAKILFNRSTAVIASVIVSFSTTMVVYSTNARGYTIVCLLTLLLLVTANWILTNQPKSWILFTILGTLGLYTIPIMIYPLGSITLWIFLEKRLEVIKPLLVTIFSIIIFTLLLYMPIILISGVSPFIKIAGNQVWAAAGWQELFIDTWGQWSVNYPIWLQILTAIGCIAGLFLYKDSPFNVPLLLSCLLFCIPVLFIQKNFPPARTWLPFLPIFAITAANGLTEISHFLFKKSLNFAIAIIALIYIAVAPFTVKSLKDPLLKDSYASLELAHFLKEEIKNEDKLLLNIPFDFLVTYYLLLFDGPTENVVTFWSGDNIEEIVEAKRVLTILSIPPDFDIAYLGKKYMKAGLLVKINNAHVYELFPLQENATILDERKILKFNF